MKLLYRDREISQAFVSGDVQRISNSVTKFKPKFGTITDIKKMAGLSSKKRSYEPFRLRVTIGTQVSESSVFSMFSKKGKSSSDLDE